jgi:hypothetical protein
MKLSNYQQFVSENKHMFPEFKSLVPKKIEIYTNNGTYNLILGDCTLESDTIRASYHHSTFNKSNKSLLDGEPDYVCFDFYIIQSPPKIITNISYGDAIVSEFTISQKGLEVGFYSGINSKLDPKTHFGLSEETTQNLIKFFKNFYDFELSHKDFNFLDKHFDTYHESIKLMPLNGSKILVIDKGSDRIDYLKDWFISRGIDFDVKSSLPKNLKDYLGIINLDFEVDYEMVSVKKETLFIGDSMIGFLKLFNADVIKLKNKLHDNKNLNLWDGELYKGLDLEFNQVNISTNWIVSKLPSGFKTTSKLGKVITGFSYKNFHGCLFHPEMSETTYGYLDNFVEILKPIQKELEKLKKY